MTPNMTYKTQGVLKNLSQTFEKSEALILFAEVRPVNIWKHFAFSYGEDAYAIWQRCPWHHWSDNDLSEATDFYDRVAV